MGSRGQGVESHCGAEPGLTVGELADIRPGCVRGRAAASRALSGYTRLAMLASCATSRPCH